jgi:hypothetical protein
MMTPNRVIIAGVLLPESGAIQQSGLGALVTQLRLQLLTPFGEAFTLPVQLAGKAEQQFRQLRSRRDQSRNLVVTGQVRLSTQFDGRFARPEDVRGERVQRMEVIAESVRPLAEGETVGASLVEIEGVVTGHPIPRTHPHTPTRDVLEVTLDCAVPHTVLIGDTTLSRTLHYRVRLAVPRRARGAQYLYVPGNKVQVVGELDCVLVRWMPDSAPGASAFQQAQANWEQAQQRFAHMPARLAQEREHYFKAIRSLEMTPRWHVLVSGVKPRRGAIRVPRRAKRPQAAPAQSDERPQEAEEPATRGVEPTEAMDAEQTRDSTSEATT